MGSGKMVGGFDGWAGPSLSGGSGGGGGAQGAQGFQGSAGAQGAQGATGAGSQGAQGFQGTAGAQGFQGTAGAQGSQGVQGTAGSDVPAWAQGQYAFLQGLNTSLGLGLTSFNFQNWIAQIIGTNVGGIGGTNLAGNEPGGSFTPAAGAIVTFTNTLVVAPKTGKFIVSHFAKLANPVAAHDCEVGITGGGSQFLSVNTLFSISTTDYVLQVVPGLTIPGTVAADAAKHWFTLVGDATNIRLYVDTVLAATTAASGLSDVNMSAYSFNSNAGETNVMATFVGY